jgi:hypothetical protein
LRQTGLGGVSRWWRQRRCCLAEAAEVMPEDMDAGAVLTAGIQVFEQWMWAWMRAVPSN